MYIAPQKSRKYSNLPDCALEIDKERREFIRYAVIALRAQPEYNANDAWSRAKQLWDTRPEDC